MEVRGTEATLRQHYAGKDVVLVRSAEPAVEPGQIVVGVFVWQPAYARRSDGDWQVTNLRYPGGGTARVSNRYPDRKWRIVNDKRRTAINAPGDFTYPTRDAAARAERECLLRASAPATA